MRTGKSSADAARARQLAQVLDARRAAFDKRCTDVAQKWKTAATEVPSEDDDIIALPPLPPLADTFSLKELFKEPIATPAFTERQLTSATSPTSLNQLAPSPADDGEPTETDLVEPTSSPTTESVDRELVDVALLQELHEAVVAMAADLDAPLAPSATPASTPEATLPLPPRARSTVPSMWTVGRSDGGSSAPAEPSVMPAAPVGARQSGGGLQPASRAVSHESKGCGVSFGPKGCGARALLERLRQVHAAHRTQRALLRQGYQQTVGALSRMHSAALAEANAAAHRRTAELAMISRQHETLSADVEARVAGRVAARTSELERQSSELQARLSRIEGERALAHEQLVEARDAKRDALERAQRAHADCRAAEEYADLRARQRLELERRDEDRRREYECVLEREAHREERSQLAVRLETLAVELEAAERALASRMASAAQMEQTSAAEVEAARMAERQAMRQMAADREAAETAVAASDVARKQADAETAAASEVRRRWAEALREAVLEAEARGAAAAEARAAEAIAAAEARAAEAIAAAEAEAAVARTACEAAEREKAAAECYIEEQRAAHAHQLATLAVLPPEPAAPPAPMASSRPRGALPAVVVAAVTSSASERRGGAWDALLVGQTAPAGGWTPVLGPAPGGGAPPTPSAATSSAPVAPPWPAGSSAAVQLASVNRSSEIPEPRDSISSRLDEPQDSISSRLEALGCFGPGPVPAGTTAGTASATAGTSSWAATDVFSTATAEGGRPSTFASDAAILAEALALGFDEWSDVAARDGARDRDGHGHGGGQGYGGGGGGGHSSESAFEDAEEAPRRVRPLPSPGGMPRAHDFALAPNPQALPSLPSLPSSDGWMHHGQSAYQTSWDEIEELVGGGGGGGGGGGHGGGGGFTIRSPLPSASPAHRSSAAVDSRVGNRRALPARRPTAPPTPPREPAASPRRNYAALLDEYMSGGGGRGTAGHQPAGRVGASRR